MAADEKCFKKFYVKNDERNHPKNLNKKEKKIQII